MTITIPLPHRNLSPNARCHWGAKSRCVRQHRHWAKLACMDAMNRQQVQTMVAAKVQAVFYFRTRQRRDGDNLLASMKASFDGLIDAGLLADDSAITHLPVVQRHDKANPRVELRVFPMTLQELKQYECED